MTKEISIEEGNKLIAEFMGYKQHNHGSYKTFEIDGKHIYESVLQYHSSWDWLMPVVKMCMSKSFELSKGKRGYEDNLNKYRRLNIEEGLRTVDIEAVWLAVIQFIKWYNSNQSK